MCALEWLDGPMYGLCLIKQLVDALQGISGGEYCFLVVCLVFWLAYMTWASIEKGLPLNFEHEISPIFFLYLKDFVPLCKSKLYIHTNVSAGPCDPFWLKL